MRDDRLYLSNIKECIERIESYTIDGKETFLQLLSKIYHNSRQGLT